MAGSTPSSEGEPPHSTTAAPAVTDDASCGDCACVGGGPLDSAAHPTWEQRRAGRQYTIGEEIANSISHGIGAGLSIAALVLLIVFACTHGGGLKLVSALMFGIALLLEYLFSTLYHAIQPVRAKRVLRIFDHCAIYILIAGTYAPFLLGPLRDEGGIAMCVAMWVAALIGVTVEAFSRERQPKWVSALIYLVMGWVIVFKLPALVGAMPEPGLWLLFAGGLSYTVGVLFYLLKKVPYMHMVWHLFVLGGSVCHFLAVLLFVY
ncbi:MAG: hemolysin III family protein [Coriobacteriia bacterium]|nr:hemolysin III family protein [Coriobacteriia bacterium]MBS5477445.1 hemolysin III family protein [Coriobacteriia bacterium]